MLKGSFFVAFCCPNMMQRIRKANELFKLSKKEHFIVRDETIRTILSMPQFEINIFFSNPDKEIVPFVHSLFKTFLDKLINTFPKFNDIDPQVLDQVIKNVIKNVLGQIPREIEALGLVSLDINNRGKSILEAWHSIKGKK